MCSRVCVLQRAACTLGGKGASINTADAAAMLQSYFINTAPGLQLLSTLDTRALPGWTALGYPTPMAQSGLGSLPPMHHIGAVHAHHQIKGNIQT